MYRIKKLDLPAPFLPTSALWPLAKGSMASCCLKDLKPLIFMVLMSVAAYKLI